MSAVCVVSPSTRSTAAKPVPPIASSSTTPEPASQPVDKDADGASRTTYGKNRRASSSLRRSSVSTSTRSLRSEHSSKPTENIDVQSAVDPASPARLSRKRTAETGAESSEEEASGTETIKPMHSRGDSGDSRSSAKSVCICQPEPRIPRPRNAFILYRQHHQAAVAAENPGIPNPNISKIIGKQWKSEPASVKSEWKQLAEEDKIRHQEQHPGYRYRPRRNDRRGSVQDIANSTSATKDKSRCTKCGGRSISTTSPSTTITPIPPSTARSSASPVSRQPIADMNNLSLRSPHSRKPRTGAAGLHINAAASRQRLPEEAPSPASPDPKRRRFNGPQLPYYQRTPGGPATPFAYPALGPMGMSFVHARKRSLPRPAELFGPSPPGSATFMGPPPTPRQLQYTGSQSPRTSASGLDRMSLTLPPIQSPTANGVVPQSSTQGLPSAGLESRFRERRSFEDIIKSISFLWKLKTLRNIAPPVGTFTSSQTSKGLSKPGRGAIVAVEGLNSEAVASLSAWLQDYLGKSGDHEAKVIDGPSVPAGLEKATIDDVLEVVKEWHGRKKEIVDFVGPRFTESEDVDQASEDADEDMSDAPPSSDENRSDSGKREQPAEASAATAAAADEGSRKSSTVSISSARTPVVILSNYTLRACDRYACVVSINDAYKPVDHWQWMATLWRGVPGPDITIYINEIDAAGQSASNGVEAGDRASANEREKVGVVDKVGNDKEDGGLKCLVVHKEKGKEVEEKALRRLGFELGEWVRSVGTSKA